MGLFENGKGPAANIWRQLPADAQRALSGQAQFAKGLDLVFDDDGTCPSPKMAGEWLGRALLDTKTVNVSDALQLAVEFTETLARKNAPKPPSHGYHLYTDAAVAFVRPNNLDPAWPQFKVMIYGKQAGHAVEKPKGREARWTYYELGVSVPSFTAPTLFDLVGLIEALPRYRCECVPGCTKLSGHP